MGLGLVSFAISGYSISAVAWPIYPVFRIANTLPFRLCFSNTAVVFPRTFQYRIFFLAKIFIRRSSPRGLERNGELSVAVLFMEESKCSKAQLENYAQEAMPRFKLRFALPNPPTKISGTDIAPGPLAYPSKGMAMAMNAFFVSVPRDIETRAVTFFIPI